jgi:hypothetical protein
MLFVIPLQNKEQNKDGNKETVRGTGERHHECKEYE